MRAEKQPLTCGNSHDADGGLCVILRHLRHAMTQPMTH
jgi:hypothetical protein